MLRCVRKGGLRVPKFVIEREIPGAGNLSDSQLREVSQNSVAVLQGMGPKIQWLHSYVTGDKVYCVYLAPDEETIRNTPGASACLPIASLLYGGFSTPQAQSRRLNLSRAFGFASLPASARRSLVGRGFRLRHQYVFNCFLDRRVPAS